MIQISPNFKANLAQLPAIDAVERIELIDTHGTCIATIENQPGKQGSLAVYHYLHQQFDSLDTQAAEHALAVFGEHTADARAHRGAHPNVDRLIDVIESGQTLGIRIVPRV